MSGPKKASNNIPAAKILTIFWVAALIYNLKWCKYTTFRLLPQKRATASRRPIAAFFLPAPGRNANLCPMPVDLLSWVRPFFFVANQDADARSSPSHQWDPPPAATTPGDCVCCRRGLHCSAPWDPAPAATMSRQEIMPVADEWSCAWTPYLAAIWWPKSAQGLVVAFSMKEYRPRKEHRN